MVLGGRAFDPAVVEDARAAVRRAAAPGAPTPAAARAASGLPPPAAAALVDDLVAEDGLTLRGDGDLEPALEALARLLEDAGLHPPTPHQLGEDAGLAPAELRAALGRLRAAGRAAPAGDRWFASAALDGAAARAREALAERPMGVAELRDLWGVGRRGALAIAAHLDERGVTVRREEESPFQGPRVAMGVWRSGVGIEPTGRGPPAPARFEDEAGHQAPAAPRGAGYARRPGGP